MESHPLNKGGGHTGLGPALGQHVYVCVWCENCDDGGFFRATARGTPLGGLKTKMLYPEKVLLCTGYLLECSLTIQSYLPMRVRTHAPKR